MGGWKIHGSDVVYDIQFQANPNIILPQTSPIQRHIALTGIPDVDINILANLDDKDLFNACLVDNYIASLCRSDQLWYDKVQHRFVGAEKYKSAEKEWRKYYMELADVSVNPTTDDANNAAGNGHLDVLKWLEQKGILPDNEGAGKAAKNGYLNVLKWLEQWSIFPWNSDGAANNGHYDILEWLGMRGIYPRGEGAYEWLQKKGIV